jgi:hypothetical protein
MNWFNNFSGGFSKSKYGGGYSGNTQTLSSPNTQQMDYRYGAIGTDNNMSWGYGTGGQGSNPYVQFRPGAIGFGFNGVRNTGWGRPDESGRYYNYPNEPQPYDNFLIRGFNPGYAQAKIVETRNRRRNVERTIDSIGQVGFWGGGSGYPLSLYVG